MKIPHLLWRRVSERPYLSPLKNSLASEAVTTPDILASPAGVTLFAGAVQEGRERIISFQISEDAIESPDPSWLASASLVLEAGPRGYDREHVFDPALLLREGETLLYYSAVGEGPDSIGLARSAGGSGFRKHPGPLLEGRSPEIIFHGGNYYLFYVLKYGAGAYRIHLATSSDGTSFQPSGPGPVLTAGAPGEWDQFEVTTPRLFEHRGFFYMLYAGCGLPERQDIPNGFGLARSGDLVSWDKYPLNPVFWVGGAGKWDDGAIWFGTVFPWQDFLYLIYEGGRLVDIFSQSPALTQVGLARLPIPLFDKAIALWDR